MNYAREYITEAHTLQNKKVFYTELIKNSVSICVALYASFSIMLIVSQDASDNLLSSLESRRFSLLNLLVWCDFNSVFNLRGSKLSGRKMRVVV